MSIETYKTTVELTVAGVTSELEIEVVGDYSPACKGSFEGGLQIEPDAPASLDLSYVWLTVLGKRFDILDWLTEAQKDALVVHVLEDDHV